MLRFTTMLWLLLAATTAFAAPIAVQSVHKDTDGVTLKMSPGLLKLQVCTDRIVHVVYSPTDTFPTAKSFVIIKKWTPVPFELKSDSKTITLLTGKVQVRVDRASGGVHFFNLAGQPILEEPASGGKTLTPAVVNNEQLYHAEQTFVSPSNECLYGMGQYQEGLWNWRGIPLQVRQQNTQISLPMLISSKGYGLLWDNASLTDFNPADDQISVDPQSHAGTFKTGAAGEYVFMVRDADRSGEVGIEVNGQIVADIKNMWVPYAITGKINLPANQEFSVRILGGGGNAKLYARPLGNTTTFRSQAADVIDYTFFYGPNWNDIVQQYRVATGQAPMWPKWAYGFWQCEAWYHNQQELLTAANEYRKQQIPLDLMVQDWQYWPAGDWFDYQWDKSRYPDPASMIQQVHDLHLKFMISEWSNPRGVVGDAMKAGNAMINGTEWSDMFNPKAREIRWDYMNRAFFSIGTDAFWQDATEPGDDGNSVENHTVFFGNGNRYRNAYPLFASKSTYDGWRATTSAKRVVVLTRSGWPGEQRYGTGCWSGDIGSNWATLRRQIPAGLNFCLTGIPYWMTDTGGFFRPDNQHESPEYSDLLTRWYQWSTFTPILRIHGWLSETELWKFPLAEKNLIAYDNLRYRFLPYNYSVAWMVTHEGYTQMRALGMDFPGDKNIYPISDEYMFGPALLVSPVTVPNAISRTVYLPAGTTWYDFWTGGSTKGGQTVTAAAPEQTIPLYVRAGSIIPFGPALQYTSEKPADPLELRVYPGANGTFTLYEDEGDSYNYEKGVYATISFTWSDQGKTLTIGARQGSFPGMLTSRTFRIVRVRSGKGVGGSNTPTADKVVTYSGKKLVISL